MKYCVLGAGMMGSAAAYDLATADPANEVLLCDVDLATAQTVARSIGPNVRPLQLDVRNSADLLAALDSVSVVISAVSYAVNYPVSRIAIEAGVHMCDMGGNNDVVDHQITLDADARRRGVLIVPNCGLAPGLINTLAMHGYSRFDTVDSIALRVGGLPQHPSGSGTAQQSLRPILISPPLDASFLSRPGPLLLIIHNISASMHQRWT